MIDLRAIEGEVIDTGDALVSALERHLSHHHPHAFPLLREALAARVEARAELDAFERDVDGWEHAEHAADLAVAS